MKNKEFEELFITQLETMLGAEKQILKSFGDILD